MATIQLDKDVSVQEIGKQERVLCIPMNHRIPKIRIRSKQVSALLNSRIVVRIDSWDIDSHYPSGHYVQQLGEIGYLETEIQALFVENGISISPFSSNMLADLPTPLSFTAELLPGRRDMRNDRVFSIDPLGSMDIDDALSVKQLSNGNIEIGVHIADVSHFVKMDSLLDIEARARGTTVYLSDRKFDMLPSVLSEDLCSLREQVDRYAVSVVWEFDSHYRIKRTWYGRTLIRSCHALYYELAQRIFDDTCTKEERQTLSNYDQLRNEITTLITVARKIRDDRLERGALELESTEIRFELNEKKDPVNIIPKRGQEINRVVAEYMILANKAVGEKIYSVYPSAALLRRHSLPRGARFDELKRLVATKGFTLDTSSNKALADSLNQCVLPSDPTFNFMLRSLVTQLMEEAEYISTGSCDVTDYYHYGMQEFDTDEIMLLGLAADFYTHFTSPIRRYADVVVHRQLLAALQRPNADPPIMNNLELIELCEHLNRKHRSSKQAQRDCTELFEALYFKTRTDVQDAVIYNIKSNGLLVIVPKYGLRGIVYLRDKAGNITLPVNALSLAPEKYVSTITITDCSYDEENQRMVMHTSKGPVQIALFDHLTVRIVVGESRAHRCIGTICHTYSKADLPFVWI